MLALLLQCSVFSLGEDRLPIYRADARSVYLNDKVVFSIPSDKIDGLFNGPIAMGSEIVFIESSRNLLLRFSGEKLVSQKTMWTPVPWNIYHNFYSNTTSAIVRIKQGVLLYGTDGHARLLTNDFKLKRLSQLDLKPMSDGVPYQKLYDTVYSGKMRLGASVDKWGDRYVIIDLDSLKILEKGLASDAEGKSKETEKGSG